MYLEVQTTTLKKFVYGMRNDTLVIVLFLHYAGSHDPHIEQNYIERQKL
jgi:hypothetical protein